MARLVVGAGETLRAQVATLPEMPKPQQLDGDMAQLRVQRLQFENQLEKLSQREFKRDDGSALTNQSSASSMPSCAPSASC